MQILLNHALPDMAGPWCAGGCAGARGRSCAAAEHGGDAGGDGLARQLRADEVDVAVEGTGRQQEPLPRHRLRAHTHQQVLRKHIPGNINKISSRE